MDMMNKVKVDVATLHIAALSIIVLLLLLSASAASAATITVNDSGGADYTTIQAAVDNARGNGVVDAWDCTYLARALAGVWGEEF